MVLEVRGSIGRGVSFREVFFELRSLGCGKLVRVVLRKVFCVLGCIRVGVFWKSRCLFLFV